MTVTDEFRRPQSLVEVAEWSASGADFDANLIDFLHQFRAEGRTEMLEAEPATLASRFPSGPIADAYLAATACHLADSLAAPSPAWTRKPERFCRHPWFASPGPHMRAYLLVHSPAHFRERNLFVSEDDLEVL